MISLAPSAGLLAHVVITAPLAWTIAVVVLSVIAWVILRAKGWGAAAGWTALALAGQACALQLFEVGNRIRLQLFFGWSDLLHSWRHVFLFTLALQALLVAWGLCKYLRPGMAVLWRTLSLLGVVAILGVMAFSSATIAPEVAQAFVRGGFAATVVMHVSKIALGMAILLVGAANLALAAATIPKEIVGRLTGAWHRWDRRALPWLAALWVVVVSSVLCWTALGAMPHVPDEVSYIFQAKYISAGRLYLPPPPDADALQTPFQFVENGKWFASPPAGWAFVFAIGYWAGVPWLINPLLGGLGVLLAHIFVRRIYDRDAADAVALLLATSPWLLYLSASFMPHAATLVFALLGLIGVERARNAGSVAGAALAGLGFGALLHTRPLESVVLAGVAGIWWLSAGWKKLRITAVVATAATGLAMAGLFLAYNKTLTGSAALLPITEYTDVAFYKGSNRLGFGADIGNFGWEGLDALPGHGPIDVVMNTNQNMHLLNFELFGWAGGSLIFVLLLMAWGKWRQDALMWGLLVALWAALSLYWFSGGPDFGARYWYQMILPCVVLTVRGASEMVRRLQANEGAAAPHIGSRVWAFVALASLIGVINVIPWRALDKYHNYRGVRADIRSMIRENDFGKSLVIVRGKPFPDFACATPFNPPTYDRDYPGPIFALDVKAESTNRVKEFYADRPVWVITAPTEKGGTLQIVERPSSR